MTQPDRIEIDGVDLHEATQAFHMMGGAFEAFGNVVRGVYEDIRRSWLNSIEWTCRPDSQTHWHLITATITGEPHYTTSWVLDIRGFEADPAMWQLLADEMEYMLARQLSAETTLVDPIDAEPTVDDYGQDAGGGVLIEELIDNIDLAVKSWRDEKEET